MSITRRQADDLLAENYGSHLLWDDPEWWDAMRAQLMAYPSVRKLRRANPGWLRIPRWWPGAQTTKDRP